MANESAVENISDLETTGDVPGMRRGNQSSHAASARYDLTDQGRDRTVDAALVGAETDDEGNIIALGVDVTDPDASGSRERYYVGFKSGAGQIGRFSQLRPSGGLGNQERERHRNFRRTRTSMIKRLDVDPHAEGRANE